MANANSRLEQLKKQQATLNARIQQLEAQTKEKNRKKDTRRKILIGSYYLDQAQKEGNFEPLKKVLAGYLTRNTDRALFDLEPLTEQEG